MTGRRFAATCAVVFLVQQTFEIAIHGFILGADYEPFRGTLLRSMATGPVWQASFLPVAHLSFVIAYVWLYSRVAEPGPRLRQGLRFGGVAWMMTQVPLWLLWFAEQPWPGSLVIKQLCLELGSALVIGVVVAAMYRPAVAARRT